MPLVKNKKTKTKKLKKALVAQAQSKKTKNTLAYYQCLCHQTKQGLKGKKITKVCQECKTNALTINAKMSAQKTKAIKKMQVGYQQLGKGLDEFIKSK
jgi:hypothetical protein